MLVSPANEDLREDLSFDAKLALMEGIISQLPEVSGEVGPA